MNSLDSFHPLIAEWFSERLGAPTAPQSQSWRHIAAGEHTLIAAPTGSGKTLAAFLWFINRLLKKSLDDSLDDRTHVVYVSPLKALSNDIEKNLQVPLREVLARAARVPTLFGEETRALAEIRVAVRTGDTSIRDRERMRRKPPHILITTPESLFILLTAPASRRYLATAEAVIVDEIHAIAGDKRGSHLALSLERLDRLCGRKLQRIGLSATQKPVEEMARLLTGKSAVEDSSGVARGRRAAREALPFIATVDVGHRRDLELTIEIPEQELGPIASNEQRAEIMDRIAQHVGRNRTTLVFTNTRRLVERVAHQLELRLGEGKVAAHHGSLSRKTRLEAEQKLKSGELSAVVATASLELGLDIGTVDLVCHLGAPRSIATLLQRVGRAGHWHGAISRGILFPLTRDELVQCAAAVRAVRAGELDRIILFEKPLDVLSQQIVAIAACEEIAEEELWQLVCRARPYRDLRREEFEAVLAMLSDGISTTRGRRGAHLHRDRVNGVVKGRRGARLAAITSGGAIPDVADYDVIEEPTGAFVGRVNEDFAIESMAGDVFLLGNQSWRIRRVEKGGKVRVENAHGANPTVPFWIGEAPARTAELSAAVSDLRDEVSRRLREGSARQWLQDETGMDQRAAQQITEYVATTIQVLGVVPTQKAVVAERFFDEAGGMQLVLHTPFGGRINRAWGFALRKRFCVTFDFELQAQATDDGLVLSLGEQHSFPLENVWHMIRLATLREDLIQAMLISPMFGNRWRWNATRALALLRFIGGKKVPMPIQRMRSDDLLAAVFPDQVACQDNHAGPITPPDHPLVNETIDNCLFEAMDLPGLRAISAAIQSGELKAVCVETPIPSPMSHEILNANPYAFLDDAPLEERRARAVRLRRVDPHLAHGVGALDAEAIAEVRRQAWPDVRDADELHDLLLSVGWLPVEELVSWGQWADELIASRRATVVSARQRNILVPAERIAHVAAVWGRFDREADLAPSYGSVGPPGCDSPCESYGSVGRDDALALFVQGWMETIGPTTSESLAQRIGLTRSEVEIALATLESRGIVMQGGYTTSPATHPTPPAVEWCERRLLARIHRLTIGRLRREIEPVTTTDFMRFLLRWQHVAPGTQRHGREGLQAIIEQLQGLELPAVAWERDVLGARVHSLTLYDLDALCLSGLVTWGRLSPRVFALEGEEGAHTRRRSAPARNAPLGFVLRDELSTFLRPQERSLFEALSPLAGRVIELLDRRGASFQSDLAAELKDVPARVEEALWECVAGGLVTGDGVAGLRALLNPAEHRRPQARGYRVVLSPTRGRPLPAGRWSLWTSSGARATDEARTEVWARQLLKRYGLVFRDLLARESIAPRWSALHPLLRRMEARGEIRGGRFLSGFIGEQFALPEAVEALRSTRRLHKTGEVITVSAADPLNMVGILTRGGRVSPFSNQVIAYRDGEPIAVGSCGNVRSTLAAAVSKFALPEILGLPGPLAQTA